MKKLVTILMCMLAVFAAQADNEEEANRVIWADSLQVVGLENVLVIGSPKEHLPLKSLPTAATSLSEQQMKQNEIQGIKDLTALSPSLYIPDYGSRLTSAIYLRGVGSRINTPSVGLYVDNVPLLTSAAYDFSFADVDHIDILRGPQGTLYGCGAMGGLIKIHTKSPLDYQGTDVHLSASSLNRYGAALTHYHHLTDHFSFSIGGYFDFDKGHLTNTYLNKNADKGNTAGGRLRAVWKLTPAWTLDANVDYQYSDQLGYAYAAYNKSTGKRASIAYNDDCSYYRNLLNTSISAAYKGSVFDFTSVTGYQWLRDCMHMDQDFTSADVYTLQQKQRMNTFIEEATFKSKGFNRKWDWLIGAFGSYQNQRTNSPMIFKSEGIQKNIEAGVNQNLPANFGMVFDVTTDELPVNSSFKSPVLGTALFHQSTFNNLLVKGLSFTLGARLDYMHHEFTYASSCEMPYSLSMSAMGYQLELGNTLNSVLKGTLKDDYLQLLPKAALTYHFDSDNLMYVSIAKGYRSGGYNLQMISDVMSNEMQVGMMEQVKDKLQVGMIPIGERMDVAKRMTYKPEYSWNYELGTHLSLCEHRVSLDAAIYYMDTRDQQITRFVDSGLGRMMVNAGRSQSYGAELTLFAQLTSCWNAMLNYGYTHATFTDYKDGSITTNAAGEEVVMSYDGNYVPFIPQHTLNATLRYAIPCAKDAFFQKASVGINYSGVGRIYWTEKNDVSQDFYNLWGVDFSLTKGICELSVWMKNALNTDYNSFCFNNSTSSDNFFAQRGTPFQIGFDLRFRL
ncbi:MAG: TonB-dependent receptor [Bacteroidaceae bacterium]